MEKETGYTGNLTTPTRPSPLMTGLAAFVFLALCILLLLNSMNKPPSRDEQMYCTAGVLMAQGLDIYKDFSYVSQLPYHPLMLAAVYKALGTTHYLLLGRLVTVLCEVLTMACIVAICLHLLGAFRKLGLFLGVIAIAFYATNPLVYMANGYAWNHGVVVFLIMLSLYLFVTCPFETRPCYGRFFFIGILLSIATCMRITTALVQTVFLVMVFMKHSRSQRESTLNRLSFLGGSVIALAWPLWVISKAGDSFLVNLVDIPRVYGAYLRDTGASHSKIDMALACMIQPGYLALLVAIGFVWLQARKTDASAGARNKQTLLWLIPASCFIIAFIPPTLWRQYLAVPVPFLGLTLAAPFCRLCRSADAGSAKPFQKALIASITCVLIAIGFQLVTLLRHPPQLAPSTWAPIRLHNTGRRIAQAIHGSGPVLTLAPLYALEGACTIYPELSCGSVVFRIGDLLSSQQRAQAHAVGPGTLTDLVKRTPPSAVLLGIETPGYEVPLQALTDSAWQSLAFENGIELCLAPTRK
jgi:hypothetical protein